jgi:arylsulfatase A-like enzyme
VVIFTSDHGEGLGAHHWVVKLSLYEEPAKVPMVVRFPGVVPAGVVNREHLVSGIDLMPTLCDYAGLSVPPDCRGRSLKGILERPSSAWRQFVVSELATDPQRPEVMGRMVRTARFKYIAYSIGKNNEQLFDLAADPGETHNRAGEAMMIPELKRHRELLRQWVQQTNDHFPVPG